MILYSFWYALESHWWEYLRLTHETFQGICFGVSKGVRGTDCLQKEGEDVTTAKLRSQAEIKDLNMVQYAEYIGPECKNCQAARVAEIAKSKKSSSDNAENNTISGTGGGRGNRADKFAWKKDAQRNLNKVKFFSNKVYYWCTHQKLWCLHKGS